MIDFTQPMILTDVDVALRLRLVDEDDVKSAESDGMGSEQARRKVSRAVRKVRAYARRGAIPGAFLDGREWRFLPADVSAAADRWAQAGRVVDGDGKAVSVR